MLGKQSLKPITSIFSRNTIFQDGIINPNSNQQIRGLKWPSWRMLKDHNKRMCVKQFAEERARINTIRRCGSMLPIEIREIADKEIVEKVPRNSGYIRVNPRCMITSKPRAVQIDWRLGRMCFRHLADLNKLSGIQRALW